MIVSTYPPRLISVAALPCESQNTENIILQWDITKKLHQMIIASSKWTRVIMCFKFTYSGCCTTIRVWNKDSWHQWTVKTLNANLVWLWPAYHWHCDWPAVWAFKIMCACWWYGHFRHMLWHKCSFMWFSRTFYEMSMKFDAYNGYFVVRIKSWSCVHMHFQCFNFHKVV